MSEKAERRQRVVRILNLLAYVGKHPNSTVMEMARDLGSDPVQVREDLDVLHLSGVGKHAGEMIDLEHDWTKVTIIDSQGLDKPLRLTPTEANALLLLLESLETMPGLVDSNAAASAADKIRAVTLGGTVGDPRYEVSDGTPAIIAQALGEGRQLELTYYSVTSDTTSTRTVSPIDTFHSNGQTYLRALDNGEVKHFRFDRIRGAELLDDRITPQASASSAFDPADPFHFSAAEVAALKIRRDAAWLADYWDLELDADDVESLSDPQVEWVRATLRYGSGDWLVRFCLGQADRVVLVEPKELADEVQRRASLAIDTLL
ncbi:WYL domain-containing protein [Corynebacterium sp. TA-R-1]|uniref:WYL domain-containing protein n=1 Tax=Corynebacterium stercoris TaxID=2943490 RepID=A0ABT1FZ89_9CORY|nr:WYL domain-containing protein [Corynebacterium stercoris]